MREPMPTDHHSRRNFLSSAGTGFAGAVFGAGALRADSTVKTSSSNEFDVRAFGAAEDGTTLDSPAIDKAIAAAADEGGGTVRFPAGTYLSYTIHLKSNVTLFLNPGTLPCVTFRFCTRTLWHPRHRRGQFHSG